LGEFLGGIALFLRVFNKKPLLFGGKREMVSRGLLKG